MKPLSDQFLALRMLEAREQGYTFRLFYRRNLGRYAFLFLVSGATIALVAQLRLWSIASLILGMVVGAVLRDLGWLRSVRRTWPFTRKVMDWEKVERLAAEAEPRVQ